MEIYQNDIYNISRTLEEIANIQSRMLAVMSKPENKVMTFFKYVGAGVSALSILSIIEIIRRWIIGG